MTIAEIMSQPHRKELVEDDPPMVIVEPLKYIVPLVPRCATIEMPYSEFRDGKWVAL